MVISVGQHTHALEMFQKMAYSKSIEEYDGYYTDLKSSSPRSVLSYYDRNWHRIREQWVMCMKNSSENFLNNTNNRLESINQKNKICAYKTWIIGRIHQIFYFIAQNTEK